MKISKSHIRHPQENDQGKKKISACKEETLVGTKPKILKNGKMQGDLAAERSRLQTIDNNLLNAALIRFEVDLQTRKKEISYLSKSWQKMTNYAIENLPGDISQILDIIHPDDATLLLKGIETSAKKLTPLDVDVRLYYRKNEIHWIHLSSCPYTENDRIIFDGFISDVTKYKIVERKQELDKKNLEELVSESSKELNISNEELTAINEELHATNDELYNKNNQLEKEIEARKSLMHQLKNSEIIRKNFIEQAIEGIIIVNDENKVVEWNKRQEEITGIAKKDALNRYEWDILMEHLAPELQTSENLEKMRYNRLNCVKNKTQYHSVEETRFHLSDGTVKDTLGTIFPIVLNDSCYLGFIIEDITEKKLISTELERYKNHLEQMVEQKTCELRDSQEQLVSLSNNLSGGIILQIIVDGSNTQISFISDTVTDLFDIDPASASDSYNSLLKLFPSEDRQLLLDHFSGKINASMLQIESFVTLDSGEPKWIHTRLAKRNWKGGKIAWEGFMIDITKRKTSDLKLARIHKKQTLLIDIMQKIQFSNDPDDAINYAMAKVGEFLGLSRIFSFVEIAKEKIIQYNYEWCNKGVASRKESLHKISSDVVGEWFDILNSNDYICASDIRDLPPRVYKTLENSSIKAIVVFPLINNGNDYGFIGFEDYVNNREWKQDEINLLMNLTQSISEIILRSWAEKSLLRSRQTLRTVLDNVNASIFVVDYKTTEILFANKKIKELINDETIEGKTLKNISDNEYFPPDFYLNEQLVNKEIYPDGLLLREEWNPKTHRWYECTDSAIEWIDGRTVYMGYLTDITERKQKDMELIKAKEKAEESDHLKSAFLANMSHEIRTPVNGINGFLGFLEDENISNKRRNEFISIIRNSSEQLVKLIDDIIDLAKIEVGQMDIHPVPVLLNSLMKDTYLFFETYLKTNNKTRVNLILDDGELDDNSKIYVDAVRLRQVLTNLINNASKFTEKGYIRFGYHKSEPDMLEFTVEDTGIGMESDQLQIIFDRFRQIEPTANRIYGGAGLGLTISKSLIHIMGGEISVQSSPGEGSLFRFKIPYIPVSKEDEPIFGIPPKKMECDISILIVEPVIMKYLYYESLLSDTGITLLHARNPQQWLNFLNQPDNIDLVFVDSDILKGCDNKIIAQIKSTRINLPLVLITKDKDSEASELHNGNGYYGIIEEPVDYTKIRYVLKDICK